MDKKSIIRIISAFICALTTFLLTGFLGYIFMTRTLGNTSYAAYTPLALPLQAVAAFLSIRIFTVNEGGYALEESDEVIEEEFVSNVSEIKEADACTLEEYPEFDHGEAPAEDVICTGPDIKRIIGEQKATVEAVVKEDEAEEDEFLGSFRRGYNTEIQTPSIYEDLPTELPEDYVPYSEEAEDEEEYEEEYEEVPRIHPLISRIAVSLIGAILAIILPINTATVYTPSKVIVRSPFSVKEYSLGDAVSYTVGVKLSGDLSMKVRFIDGKEKELIFSSATESSQFSDSYSSSYGYAAFCHRLLEKNGVERNVSDLTSLSPSPALSEKDLAYIEEITGTSITEN